MWRCDDVDGYRNDVDSYRNVVDADCNDVDADRNDVDSHRNDVDSHRNEAGQRVRVTVEVPSCPCRRKFLLSRAGSNPDITHADSLTCVNRAR